MGRKPKPIEMKQAEGNPGRRPLPAPIETAPMDTTPPALLGPGGVELWTLLVEQLEPIGVLHQIDRAGLTMLCIQWDRGTDADRVLREQGHYAKGSMGQVVPHPAMAIERAAHNAVLKFLTEYAATPVARARIATARAARAQQEEFEELTQDDVIEIDPSAEIDGDVL